MKAKVRFQNVTCPSCKETFAVVIDGMVPVGNDGTHMLFTAKKERHITCPCTTEGTKTVFVGASWEAEVDYV